MRWWPNPGMWVFAMIFVTSLAGATTEFHVYREHEQGGLRMWYLPRHPVAPAAMDVATISPQIANHDKVTRLTFHPTLAIDIRVDDDYITADTFSIYVNDKLQYVCYYDDDDHQVGNLADITINEESYTYRITAGGHASCASAAHWHQ